MEVDGHQHFYSIYDPFWEDGNLRRQASYAAEVNLESLLFDRPLSDDTSGDASASHDSSAQNISSHLQCIHCKRYADTFVIQYVRNLRICCRKLVNAKWMRLHLLEGHDPTFLLKAKESNAVSECVFSVLSAIMKQIMDTCSMNAWRTAVQENFTRNMEESGICLIFTSFQ